MPVLLYFEAQGTGELSMKMGDCAQDTHGVGRRCTAVCCSRQCCFGGRLLPRQSISVRNQEYGSMHAVTFSSRILLKHATVLIYQAT